MPPHKWLTQGIVYADKNIHELSQTGDKALLQRIQWPIPCIVYRENLFPFICGENRYMGQKGYLIFFS